MGPGSQRDPNPGNDFWTRDRDRDRVLKTGTGLTSGRDPGFFDKISFIFCEVKFFFQFNHREIQGGMPESDSFLFGFYAQKFFSLTLRVQEEKKSNLSTTLPMDHLRDLSHAVRKIFNKKSELMK